MKVYEYRADITAQNPASQKHHAGLDSYAYDRARNFEEDIDTFVGFCMLVRRMAAGLLMVSFVHVLLRPGVSLAERSPAMARALLPVVDCNVRGSSQVWSPSLPMDMSSKHACPAGEPLRMCWATQPTARCGQPTTSATC